jgi:hypothetical protein
MMGSDLEVSEHAGKWLPSATGYACRTSGRLTGGQEAEISISRIHRAIQSYLTGMQYTDQRMRGGRLVGVDLRKVKDLHLTFWNSLEIHPDYGSHRYRCQRLETSAKARDRSWMKVRYMSRMVTAS